MLVTRQAYRRTGQKLVMQLLKCVSFLLGAVILLATFGPFVAIAHRGLLMEELSIDKTIKDKEIRSNVLRGERLVFGDAGMEKTEAKDARSIPSSGANHSVGKCGHGGREDVGVNCYFRSRKLHSGVHFDGHIPYTADYGKPRHHPPKNN